MAKAVKTKKKPGKAKAAPQKGPQSFDALWTEIGKRLVKELKAEKGWDPKGLFNKLKDDPQFQVRVIESAKSVVPANSAAPRAKPETVCVGSGMGSSLTSKPSFGSTKTEGDDFWLSCDSPQKSSSIPDPRD